MKRKSRYKYSKFFITTIHNKFIFSRYLPIYAYFNSDYRYLLKSYETVLKTLVC